MFRRLIGISYPAGQVKAAYQKNGNDRSDNHGQMGPLRAVEVAMDEL